MVDRAGEDHLGNFSNHAVHRSHGELSSETGLQKAESLKKNARGVNSIRTGPDDHQFAVGLFVALADSLAAWILG